MLLIWGTSSSCESAPEAVNAKSVGTDLDRMESWVSSGDLKHNSTAVCYMNSESLTRQSIITKCIDTKQILADNDASVISAKWWQFYTLLSTVWLFQHVLPKYCFISSFKALTHMGGLLCKISGHTVRNTEAQLLKYNYWSTATEVQLRNTEVQLRVCWDWHYGQLTQCFS